MKEKILFLLINIGLVSFSQNLIPKEEIKLFEIDQFENIFIVNKNNKLIKYPENNYKNPLEFKNTEYGNIQKIMVSNPFRLILFYRDSQKIVFLDKNLNELSLILDLNNILNERIIDITYSLNLLFFISELNEVFIYDISRKKIKRKKKINLSKYTDNIEANNFQNIISSQNHIILINNSHIITLNHELDFLFYKAKKMEETKIIFDQNKYYKYEYQTNQLFSIEIDNTMSEKLIQNTSDSLFTIKNKQLFIIKNGQLKKQLLK